MRQHIERKSSGLNRSDQGFSPPGYCFRSLSRNSLIPSSTLPQLLRHREPFALIIVYEVTECPYPEHDFFGDLSCGFREYSVSSPSLHRRPTSVAPWTRQPDGKRSIRDLLNASTDLA
ncbi:hypothetical protein CLAIMM_00592 isoform 2 [Cladophialophora immunda]|nr:hypothetical protein CLAIMM_00592 isoform 1 [Cladophialophora immunda]OQU94202.1 hypothetical protein CLAIMM_00592 isoform 2 [Cladophialophora immunda]